MTLFPLTRPRLSLYFSTDRFCFGRIRHGPGFPKFRTYLEQALPTGTIRLSPIDQNVTAPERVLPILHANLSAYKRPLSVALCLPDLLARTTVMELDSLPRKKKDQTALVEWRLQQALTLSPKSRRLSYQVFEAAPSRGPFHHARLLSRFAREPRPRPASAAADGHSLSGSRNPVHLLVTTMENDILEPYEKLCLDAGCIPVSIHVASVAVFNLCRPMIQATLQTHSPDVSFVPDAVIFLYVGDWGFSFIVFRNGQPRYLRVKPVRRISTVHVRPSPSSIEDEPQNGNAQTTTPRKRTGPSVEPETPDDNHEPATILAQEALGSLQFYFETAKDPPHPNQVYPVFLTGSPQPAVMLPRIAEIMEQAFPPNSGSVVPQVKPFPVFPENPNVRAESLSGLTQWTGTALATFAGGYGPS